MKRIFLISLAVLLAACRADSVFPGTDAGNGGNGGGDDDGGSGAETVSIAYLKTLYKGAPVRITGEYRIVGTVVSSDVQGNFHKTLVVEDDTGGLEIKIDRAELFKLFLIHSRVTVRCNGLWIGSYGGTLQLGSEPSGEYQTGYIAEGEISSRFISDDGFYGEVMARRMSFGELSPSVVSTFAGFEDVQFAADDDGLNWGDTVNGEYALRHLTDRRGDTLLVRTSPYALFADKKLPTGSGYIEGILGYFNGEYQLTVNTDQNAEMRGARF